jgi:cobaltochelatase CobT
MATPPNPLEDFRLLLGATARALSKNPSLDVHYTADEPTALGSSIRVMQPARSMPEGQVGEARGYVDASALKARYHNARVHSSQEPSAGLARDIYNALEQARVEAIGARTMVGVAANLDHMLQARCRTDPIARARSAEEVPLAMAVSLLVRQRLTGALPPESARNAVQLVQGWIEEHAALHLDQLAQKIEDQAGFAKLTRQIIIDLKLGDELQDTPEPEEDTQDQQGQEQSPNDEGGEDAQQASGQDTSDTPEASPETMQGEQDQSAAMETDALLEGDAEEQGIEGATSWRPNHPLSDLPPDFDYKAFTLSFDEVVHAEALCEAEELVRLRAYLDQQLVHLQGIVTKLANRLQRRLLAQQNRAWDFDLEEGVLDSARLTRVVVNPAHALSYMHERDTDFRDTVVTLLIDNSGSMRGRPISIAAICADILARTLERCAVKVEILGFTTKAWKGGQSREKWLGSGRPAKPGRLNDLRHIIYKTADAPWRRARKNLGLMMREGLLKENIDGEGLLWAHSRLLARPEERRILMVISDGAPVDDSTLSVNTGTYLERHLRQVIGWIETRSSVELIAIGIGHDVTRYYRKAVTIMDAEQLGGAMTEQLAHLFEDDIRKRGKR